MADTLRSALLISAIGMGLVFGVILLLWGLIALVVRLGANRPGASEGGPDGDEAIAEVAEELDEEAGVIGAKSKAAAAAVGAYLASERRAP